MVLSFSCPIKSAPVIVFVEVVQEVAGRWVGRGGRREGGRGEEGGWKERKEGLKKGKEGRGRKKKEERVAGRKG